ncbi:MAG: amidinotransferase [Bacteroidia bacterium]|nr:amidinotransferase [Bacteroidia bacterium]
MENAGRVFMIRPFRFKINEQTAVTNSFQQPVLAGADAVSAKAAEEFDALADLLKNNGVEVIMFRERSDRDTPDSIFPNNWISFHESGLFLYPMQTENRRKERSAEILEFLKPYVPESRIVDLSIHERAGLFLEGTGSLVVDYGRRIVYAALSPRTSEVLVNQWAGMFGMVAVTFRTTGDIYHTNVILTVGSGFAMLGSGLIPDKKEREKVISFLERSGKQVIHLTEDQIRSFAGNSYELVSSGGENLILMSSRAFESLNPAQKTSLERFGRIIHCPVPTIESAGGGSVRCMIADMNAWER